MRAGEHVHADHTGAHRRGRPDRPERAPAPRPDTHRERGQGREAGADESERDPRSARPPPRRDVGEHRGRDGHGRRDEQPLHGPDDPVGHGRRAVRLGRAAGPAQQRNRRQQQDGLGHGVQAVEPARDTLPYRCLMVGVGELRRRRDRIRRAATDPLRLRTDEQLRRLGDAKGAEGGRSQVDELQVAGAPGTGRREPTAGVSGTVGDRDVQPGRGIGIREPGHQHQRSRWSGRQHLGEIGVDRLGSDGSGGRRVAADRAEIHD
jgi:hypothetical protein